MILSHNADIFICNIKYFIGTGFSVKPSLSKDNSSPDFSKKLR